MGLSPEYHTNPTKFIVKRTVSTVSSGVHSRLDGVPSVPDDFLTIMHHFLAGRKHLWLSRTLLATLATLTALGYQPRF